MSTRSQSRRIEGRTSAQPHFGHLRAKAAALRGAAYLEAQRDRALPPCDAAVRRERAARTNSVLRVFPEYHTPLPGGTVKRTDARCTPVPGFINLKFPTLLPETQ